MKTFFAQSFEISMLETNFVAFPETEILRL